MCEGLRKAGRDAGERLENGNRGLREASPSRSSGKATEEKRRGDRIEAPETRQCDAERASNSAISFGINALRSRVPSDVGASWGNLRALFLRSSRPSNL
jgi:hypothetical protein